MAAPTTTTVTFEDERGHKAVATVVIDREEGSIDFKCAFEPALEMKEKSDRVMLLNLFVQALTGEDGEVESVTLTGTTDDDE